MARHRDLEREPRLTDATDPGERDEPRLVERVDDRGPFGFAADERAELRRQVAAKHVERVQRRELRPKIGVHDLEHALGPRDVAQAVLAEVEQRGARVELVVRQLLGRERHHHLASVRGAHQARGPVERRPVVVAVTLFGGAGVDAHADAQSSGQAPVRATEGALCRRARRARRPPRSLNAA